LIRGLYISASGMLAEQTHLDVTANNVANANTAGFRKDVVVSQSFREMLLSRIGGPPDRTGAVPVPVVGPLGTGVGPAATFTSTVPGSVKSTGSPLDVAIEGDAYLLVNTPEGERLTRNGNLRVDFEGILVTGEGFPVLGSAGEITLPQGEVTIDANGGVSVDGNAVDTLRLVSATPGSILEKEGTSLYEAVQGYEDAIDFRVRQGFVEASNVNPVQEMVLLMEAMRTYEANQKVILAQDAALDKAVNEVGSV
jgi:flagellar basal-body rod protein FlgF